MARRLNSSPDWQSAASNLVGGCLALPGVEERVQLIEHLAEQLGDDLYPAFLQILCLISAGGDRSAKSLLTEALVKALQTGRLPSGRLSAWGTQDSPGTELPLSQVRSLGPIEFLCAWYSQPCQQQPLTEQAFRSAASYLLDLLETNHQSKQLYCAKMAGDLQDPLGGALSGRTQTALQKLLSSWQSGQPIPQVLNAYLDSLSNTSQSQLQNLGSLFVR